LEIPFLSQSFFIVTGFLIDPVAFFQSITTNFPLATAVIGALLVGKWLAVQTVGHAFGYTPAERMTMWLLTLPQVAATLAATLVAFDTRNLAGQRLVDSRLLNVVLVLMVTTSNSWTGSYRALRTSPAQRRNATGSNEDRRNTLMP
jgi:Kef-type K+ transport system membrane component KefB